MGLKPEKKQTDVGMIPRDWNVAKLGEYAAFRTGPFGSALHKADYIEDGIPVVNPMHIIDSRVIPTRTMAITEAAARKLADFRLRHRDLIIARRGDMGRCAVIREEQVGWLCGTGSMIIRCTDDLSPEFLQRLLSSPRVIATIEGSSVGSTMTNLNQAVLADLRIQIPSVREQLTMTAALADVDALLDVLTALVTKKRDIKQASMQQLLTGKTRLPGFRDGWKTKRLGDLGIWTGGATPSMSNLSYWNGGEVPWASSGDIKSNHLKDTAKMITRTAVLESSTTLLPVGAILIVTRSGILRRYLPVAKNAVSVAINQDIKAVIPHSAYSPDFLLHAFVHEGPRILASCLKAGTTVESVEYVWLKRFEISLPKTMQEQFAIAEVLSDMDVEIAALEQRLAKTRLLKQGMMQELRTGRTRLVSVAQETTA